MTIHRSGAALLVIALLVFPIFSYAETVLRVSDSVSVDDDQVVDGDFYGAAGITGPVSLSGTIAGDAHVAGGNVTANGTIEEDLFALARTVQVHASVTDDVRIVAGDATIAESVGGDLFVITGTLTVLSSANIEGDIYFFGGTGEINGAVGGSVHGTAEKLRIDGPVAGDVDVHVTRSLVLGGRADVGGDVRYESFEELVRAQNAVVVGDVVQNSPRRETAGGTMENAAIPFLVYAFTTLILFALFRNRLEPLLVGSVNSFTIDGLIGIAGMFLTPVVISLLLVTVIGSLLSVLALLGFLFLALLSFVLASMLAGLILQRALSRDMKLDLLWTLLGIIVVGALLLLPYIGPIVILVLMVVVLGSLLKRIYEGLIG